MLKLSLCIGLISTLCQLSREQELVEQVESASNCNQSCAVQMICSVNRDYVWSLVDERCRLFLNGCHFVNENCRRQNHCLSPLEPTTQLQCRALCYSNCPRIYQPMCASFPYTDVFGRYLIGQFSFNNRCEMDRYACSNMHAYVGEPIAGYCRA